MLVPLGIRRTRLDYRGIVRRARDAVCCRLLLHPETARTKRFFSAESNANQHEKNVVRVLQQLDVARFEELRRDNAAAWRAIEDQLLAHDDGRQRSAPARYSTAPEPPHPLQLRLYFAANFLPFMAFGFLDNTIMLVCGEFLDTYLGVWLGISTMAAAALGNIVGDVAGIWLGGTVEYLAGLKVEDHRLTSQQMKLHSVQRLKTVAMASGIFTGCVLGMFPLIFGKGRDGQQDDGGAAVDSGGTKV
eukprot:g6789.t1